MIGKMYRPVKVNKLKKRGLYIENKYKSNFGGYDKFSLKIQLNYDYLNKSEIINIEIIETNLRLAVLESKNKLANKKKAIDKNNKSLKTTIYRKLLNISKKKEVTEENPSYISAYNRVLKIVLGISNEENKVDEVLQILIYPIVLENEEYLFLDTNSTTLIEKISTQDIRLMSEKEAKILHEKL